MRCHIKLLIVFIVLATVAEIKTTATTGQQHRGSKRFTPITTDKDYDFYDIAGRNDPGPRISQPRSVATNRNYRTPRSESYTLAKTVNRFRATDAIVEPYVAASQDTIQSTSKKLGQNRVSYYSITSSPDAKQEMMRRHDVGIIDMPITEKQFAPQWKGKSNDQVPIARAPLAIQPRPIARKEVNRFNVIEPIAQASSEVPEFKRLDTSTLPKPSVSRWNPNNRFEIPSTVAEKQVAARRQDNPASERQIASRRHESRVDTTAPRSRFRNVSTKQPTQNAEQLNVQQTPQPVRNVNRRGPKRNQQPSVSETKVIQRQKTRKDPVITQSTSAPVSAQTRRSRTRIISRPTKSTNESPTEVTKTVATTVKSTWRDTIARKLPTRAPGTFVNTKNSPKIDLDQLEDENYPEHFKILLKSKSENIKRSDEFPTPRSNEIPIEILTNPIVSPPPELPAREPSKAAGFLKSRRAQLNRSRPTKKESKSTTLGTTTTKNTENIEKFKFKPRTNSKLQFPSVLRRKASTTTTTTTTISSTENHVESSLQNEIAKNVSGQQSVLPAIQQGRNLNTENRDNVNIFKNSFKSASQKFSSRYRGDGFRVQNEKDKPPVYTPTVPPMTTEPEYHKNHRYPSSVAAPAALSTTTTTVKTLENQQMVPIKLNIPKDINQIAAAVNTMDYLGDLNNLAGSWNMIDPIAGGLMRSEISIDSISDENNDDDLEDFNGNSDEYLSPAGSATVSIFEALSDILSKTTENFNASSTTQAATTTTTTTTTQLPDIIQVDEQQQHEKNEMSINITTDNKTISNFNNSIISTTNPTVHGQTEKHLTNNPKNSNKSLNINPTIEQDIIETTNQPIMTAINNYNQIKSNAFTNHKFNDNKMLAAQLIDSKKILRNNLTNNSSNELIQNHNNNNSNVLINLMSINLPTSIPLPITNGHLSTPGSDLITEPILNSAIINYIDNNTSVQNINASDDSNIITTTRNINASSSINDAAATTTTAVPAAPTIINYDNSDGFDNYSTESINEKLLNAPASTMSTEITTDSSTFMTISFLELFTIKPRKIHYSTESATIDIYPVYVEPDETTQSFDIAMTTNRHNQFDSNLKLKNQFNENSRSLKQNVNVAQLINHDLDSQKLNKLFNKKLLNKNFQLDTNHTNTITQHNTQNTTETVPLKSQLNKQFPDQIQSTHSSNTTVENSPSITTTYRPRFMHRPTIYAHGSSVRFGADKKIFSTTDLSMKLKAATSTTTEQQQHDIPLIESPNNNIDDNNDDDDYEEEYIYPRRDYLIYAVLPNNTVVRKRPPAEPSEELAVYGILSNQTLVRKYPNGTILPVISDEMLEIVDIDPKVLYNPDSLLWRTTIRSILAKKKKKLKSTQSFNGSGGSNILNDINLKNNNNNNNSNFNNSVSSTTIKNLPLISTNSTSSTSDTDNVILLEILKKNYINNDATQKSDSVFSLTTMRPMIEDKTMMPKTTQDQQWSTMPPITTSSTSTTTKSDFIPSSSGEDRSNSNEIHEFELDDPLKLSEEDETDTKPFEFNPVLFSSIAQPPKETSSTTSTSSAPITTSTSSTSSTTFSTTSSTSSSVIPTVSTTSSSPSTTSTATTTSNELSSTTLSSTSSIPSTTKSTTTTTTAETFDFADKQSEENTVSDLEDPFIDIDANAKRTKGSDDIYIIMSPQSTSAPSTFATRAATISAPFIETEKILISTPSTTTTLHTTEETIAYTTPSTTKSISIPSTVATTKYTTKKLTTIAPQKKAKTQTPRTTVSPEGSLERNLRLLQELLGLQANLARRAQESQRPLTTTTRRTTMMPQRSTNIYRTTTIPTTQSRSIPTTTNPTTTTTTTSPTTTTTTTTTTTEGTTKITTTPKVIVITKSAKGSVQSDLNFLSSLIGQEVVIDSGKNDRNNSQLLPANQNQPDINEQLKHLSNLLQRTGSVENLPKIENELSNKKINTKTTVVEKSIPNKVEAQLATLSSLLGRRITLDDLPNIQKEIELNKLKPINNQATLTTTEKLQINNLESSNEINGQLSLLSSLLGRRVTIEDLPKMQIQIDQNQLERSKIPISTNSERLQPVPVRNSAEVNSQLALLSSLLGRKVTIEDLPNIQNQLKPPAKIQTTTTTEKLQPALVRNSAEVNSQLALLSSLLGRRVNIEDLPNIQNQLKPARIQTTTTTEKLQSALVRNSAEVNSQLALLSSLLGRRVNIEDLPNIQNQLKPAAKIQTTTTTEKLQPVLVRNSAEVNSQLALLSSLLGRRVTIEDLPNIQNQLKPAKIPTTTTTEKLQPELVRNSAEVNSQLALLSSLLGRKVTIEDLPNIQNEIKENRVSVQPTTTLFTTTTTTKKPTQKMSAVEINNELLLLSSLLGRNVNVGELPKIRNEMVSRRENKLLTTTVPTTTTTTTTTTPKPPPTTTISTTTPRLTTTTATTARTTKIVTTVRTTRAPKTTVATQVTRKPSTSDQDDINFLQSLRQVLSRNQPAAIRPTNSRHIPKTTKYTTEATTTTTTTAAPTPTHNIEALLNSFQTIEASTLAPKRTNADDLAFLNSLRQIAKLNTAAPTNPPTFANRIVELALQGRTPALVAQTKAPIIVTPAPLPVTFAPPKARPALSEIDFQSHQQDLASVNGDLALLSTLLGRRITAADLPNLRNEIALNRQNRKPTTTLKPEQTTPMSKNKAAEVERNLRLLSSLLGRQVSINELPLIMSELQGTRITKETTSLPASTSTPKPDTLQSTLPDKNQAISKEEILNLLKNDLASQGDIEVYGKTNEALLAALLKQRGIGPAHNNIPVNDLFTYDSGHTPFTTTTRAPRRERPPPPQRRPILDGLAWLWNQWQQTAPNYNRGTRGNSRPTTYQRPQTVQLQNNDGLDPEYVTSNDFAEAPSIFGGGGTAGGFGGGGGLLAAAIGMTRAVTSFLGNAFQGAATSFQGAWQDQQQTYYGLSG